MELNSIPKIYALGTRFNHGIFDGQVWIQEKYDGSQFSFKYLDGVLACRSKGTLITGDPGMFRAAVETATALAGEGKLMNGAQYQCEFLAKQKHNVLCYERVPAGNLVLFDIMFEHGAYVHPAMVNGTAAAIGLEPCQILHSGAPLSEFDAPAVIEHLLKGRSSLGGPLEGIVIKNYDKSHPERENHPMTAKIVRPEFKEKQEHGGVRNPKAGTDQIQGIINALRTEARWLKAIQHLREAGQLKGDNSDIGPLLAEVWTDILAEEEEFITRELFDAFNKDIRKGVLNGFAQFYQKILQDGMSVFQEHQTTPQIVDDAGKY